MHRKLSLLLLLSFFFIHLSATRAQTGWTQKPDYAGGGVWYAISFSIGQKAYVGLGGDGGGYRNDFWQYDTLSNTWTQKASFPGSPRIWTVSFSINAKGYVGTGQTHDSLLSCDFWEYDTLSNSWSQKANFAGTPRNRAVGFSIGNNGYIATGADINGAWQNDLWQYEPLTDTWTQKTSMPNGTNRISAVGFSIGSKGYVGTGLTQYWWGNYCYNDLWSYNPDSDSWSQKANLPAIGRMDAVGFSINGKGYIGTGVDTNNYWYHDFYEYDTLADSWLQRSNVSQILRYACSGFSIGNKGYIGFGSGVSLNGDTLYSYLQDFWEYYPPADTITLINSLSQNKNEFSTYPNPFTNEIGIRMQELKNKGEEIILFDITGKEILRQKTSEAETKLNTEGIAAGFYLLRVGERNFKVIKQQ
jgi:N-acetylneuraminic acid mutarotase